MKFSNFFITNKIVFSIILIGLSILVVGIIGNKIIENESANWPESIDQKIYNTENRINEIISNKQKNLLNKLSNVKSSILNSNKIDFDLFDSLKNFQDQEKIALAIFDKNNSIIYWNENYFDELTQDTINQFSPGELFFISTNLLHSLAVKDTLSFHNIPITIFLSLVLEKGYRLNPDYMYNQNLTKFITNEIGTDCEINYSTTNKIVKDGRKHSFDIINNFNNKIGTITFIKQSREKDLIKIENLVNIIQSILALLGYILLGIFLINNIKKVNSLTIKFLYLSTYLIVFRYLLVALKFPQILFSSDLLTDKYYYSSFGFGIANSVIHLGITIIFFKLIIYILYKYSLKNFERSKSNNRKNVYKTLLNFILFLVIYLLALRGLGASIRGFIFDTSLRYFQDQSLTISLPNFLMEINVLLLGITFIIGAHSFILFILSKYSSSDQKYKNIVFIIILSVFTIAVIAFTLLQRNPQITLIINLLITIIVFISLYLIITKNYKRIIIFIIYFLSGSFISIITMLYYNSNLEMESLKTTAHVINRANENYYKKLISETLINSYSRKEALKAFANKKSNFNAYAFKIWSQSDLQKESVNSSVNFINLKGELLGGFGSVYPRSKFDKIISSDSIIEEIYIFNEPTPINSQRLIRGVFPIVDHYSIIGYLDVSILFDLNDFGFDTHPEFISTGKLNDKAILKLDKLKILDYHNSELKSIYGEITPTAELNSQILSTKLSNKNDAWLNISVNGVLHLIYLQKVKLNNTDRLLAVALRNKDLSLNLFDFFKVFFSHSIVLIFLVLSYLLLSFKKERKYLFNLRSQLLAAFLIISIIPLILLALYFKNLTEEKNKNSIYYKLGKRAFIIENYLNENLLRSGNFNNFIFSKASSDLNLNYSLYSLKRLEYSSDDLLYDVGLIPKIINPKAYKELIINDNQEALIVESIDKYKFNSFFYKANILGQQYVIKITDAFNKISVPLSGSEVEVFFFGTFSFAFILIIIFSALLANKISSPIRKLTLATKSIAAGDLNLEINSKAKGEVKDLVNGFQYMVKELKKNQAILAEIEREEAWKEMAKQVAHEIKNPLTPMKLSIQQLITAYNDKSEKFDDYFKRITNTVLNQIETLKNIATEFSSFARMPKLKVEKFNCIDVLKDSINLFSDENISIELNSVIDECIISGDVEQLKRTFINLIRNSIQADANKIEFKLMEKDLNYSLIISDNGKGIEKENLSKIFDINFTTKAEGMGLGLSLAKRYLRSTGGDINAINTSSNGTEIELTFPKINL